MSHYEKIVKMRQFYFDSSRFFCNQLYLLANINVELISTSSVRLSVGIYKNFVET
jgi:hypothetical protein